VRTFRLLGLCLMIGAVVGCSQPDAELDVEGVSSALTATDVLSFDDPSLWQGPGTLESSTTRSEGSFSLATRPRGYAVYESDPFTFSGSAREILVDIQLPSGQVNSGWAGGVELYLNSGSTSVNNAFVGRVELSGLPVGTFTTLRYTVPNWIAERLRAGARDLQVRLALNVPASSAVYLLDNLRIRTELLLHYEFERVTSGNVVDSSGYERHGALRGAAALTPNGRNGSALDLNGVDAYVQLPDGVLDGVRSVTIATWVNLARVDPWSRIFDFGGSAGSFAFLTPSTHDGLLRYSAFTALGKEGVVTAPGLVPQVWKHVAVTHNGRDYRLYVDGVEAGNALTVPVPLSDLVHSVESWIGRSRFPDPLLTGRVDDFRIYDRVLTQREIATLASPQRDYANWRFDESSGRAVTDSSDLRFNGTIRGGEVSRVPGVIDRAVQLRGDGSHVELPAGIVETCTDLTVTSWVRLNTNRPWNRIFDFGAADGSSFMYLSPAGLGASGQELRFGLVTPAGAHDVGFPYVMPLREWTHVGVVLRGDTATLYLNGRPVVSQEGVSANPRDMGTTTRNSFGRSTFPADPSFDGAIDDVRLSCRAYADREIAQLAHLPPPARLPNQRPVSGDIVHVHDPVVVRSGDTYYLFSTGPGVMVRTSTDLTNWTFAGSAIAPTPQWVVDRFGELDSLWAPDVSYFGGAYHLYYSASSFGSNRSCIGHATKADLRSNEPWADRGPVICSNQDGAVDNYNAIDANVIVDQQGTPWLSFGSFWGGLQMFELDQSGARADDTLVNIAARPNTAIEAPYIVYRAPYYYLFASFDFCCRGADSTYWTAVGRSTSVTGPYLDRTGLDMRFGGGTPVVVGDARWRGPGHNAILRRNDQYLNVYHAYDAVNGGIPTLRISELVWHEGWPVNAEP
jgi:arabinan endo-1,5-alpha-L-arabinosidase